MDAHLEGKRNLLCDERIIWHNYRSYCMKKKTFYLRVRAHVKDNERGWSCSPSPSPYVPLRDQLYIMNPRQASGVTLRSLRRRVQGHVSHQHRSHGKGHHRLSKPGIWASGSLEQSTVPYVIYRRIFSVIAIFSPIIFSFPLALTHSASLIFPLLLPSFLPSPAAGGRIRLTATD